MYGPLIENRSARNCPADQRNRTRLEWRITRRETLEIARDHLNDAVPLLTGNPLSVFEGCLSNRGIGDFVRNVFPGDTRDTLRCPANHFPLHLRAPLPASARQQAVFSRASAGHKRKSW